MKKEFGLILIALVYVSNLVIVKFGSAFMSGNEKNFAMVEMLVSILMAGFSLYLSIKSLSKYDNDMKYSSSLINIISGISILYGIFNLSYKKFNIEMLVMILGGMIAIFDNLRKKNLEDSI